MFKRSIILSLSALLLLAACQSEPVNRQESPLNTGEDPRIKRRNPRKEIIVPELDVTSATDPELTKYRLMSQTARYLDQDKTEVQIVLANNQVSSCKDQFPELIEDEQRLVIDIKTNDPESPITIGDYLANPDADISAELQTPEGALELDINALSVSNVNDSIIRGQLDLANSDYQFSGEYFAAFCLN